jgi:hypothetical protein
MKFAVSRKPNKNIFGTLKLILKQGQARGNVRENIWAEGFVFTAKNRTPWNSDLVLKRHLRGKLKVTNRHLHMFRHAANVPILLSAIASKPDWLLTHNTKHFTQAVAKRTGLRIATPAEFFRILSILLR